MRYLLAGSALCLGVADRQAAMLDASIRRIFEDRTRDPDSAFDSRG
jgi:hypothetical protein